LPASLEHRPISLKGWARSRIFHAASKQKRDLNHLTLGIVRRHV